MYTNTGDSDYQHTTMYEVGIFLDHEQKKPHALYLAQYALEYSKEINDECYSCTLHSALIYLIT